MFSDIYYNHKTGQLFTNKNGVIKNVGGKHNGYLTFQKEGKVYRCHRYIWEMHNGAIPDGYIIDHINGVRDDNRLENLRLCTPSQNKMNRGLSKNNRSGYKGVIFYKRPDGYKKKKPWRVWIQYENKYYSKHGFATAREAAIHYNEKAVEFFGEFARLNKV